MRLKSILGLCIFVFYTAVSAQTISTSQIRGTVSDPSGGAVAGAEVKLIEADTGAVWASKDDPRTTAVGKWLRRVRLDELPQFFNVLQGDMSLVGPRPERPEFVRTLSEKIPYYRQRHCVKPGITGWAQINHKYGDTLEDTITKLEFDLYYIKNLSISLDAYIIFHTLKTIVLSRGAQ